jgi:crotonobetainyl-CoA:carnitine CoA-transferase CaiB-like acyl-CoA transferase
VSSKGPLFGVGVLELASVWAGPCSAMLLGLMGASVIKVESTTRPDLTRRSGSDLDSSPAFHLANIGKRSVVLDIDAEEGAQLFLKLAAAADILITNIQPPSLQRKGIDYGACAAINPRLVWAQISTSGAVGPEQHFKGYAPSFNALSGLSSLSGYDDGPPAEMRSGGDMRVAYDLTIACLAALLERRTTGAGTFIDLSCREVLTSRIGDEVVAAQLEGPVSRPAPAGCYPTADEQWLALEIRDDRQWEAFCAQLLGRPSPVQLRSVDGRAADAADVEALVTEWSTRLSVDEAARRAQAAGISAVRSMSNLQLANLPHLWQRRLFFERAVLEGPGPRRLVSAPWASPANSWPSLTGVFEGPIGGAPGLGEHTGEVLSELGSVSGPAPSVA